MKHIFFQLYVILFFLISCTNTDIETISYYPINGNAWQIELLNKKTEKSILAYATYDGRICAYNQNLRKNIWEYDSEAFIFDLKTGDIDLDGQDEIMAATASGDLLVRAYFKTYGVPTIITRRSNNIGPYQYPEKLIPLFINNIKKY